MTALQTFLVPSLVVTLFGAAGAVVLPGGGPKRTDCHAEIMADGLGFPGGASRFKGATCADGDLCDRDGTRNGSCLFTPVVCLNVADPGLPSCSPARVSGVSVKGKAGRLTLDLSHLDAAVSGVGLPLDGSACSAPVDLVVPVGGPDQRGELVRGTAQLRAKTKTSKGVDKDKFLFVCLPSVGSGGTPPTTTTTIGTVPSTVPSTMPATTSTSTTSSTIGTVPGSTTTTTFPAATPGAGLEASIVGATIGTDGRVVVTLRLTDAAGVAITPRTSATSNPNEARVRLTIARLEIDAQQVNGFTTTFTRYVNYITGSAAGGSQPTYDSTGTFARQGAMTWTYTFGRLLPAGFPNALTHTLGAQIERTFEGERLIANPTFDFVPNGSAVTTVREDTTTAQCNACHNPLEAHGGGRREVKLCVLCHTHQATDPDTHNSIEFEEMVHRLHRGKELPSVADGPVGAKYSIVGFGGSELVFGEKVKACVNGRFPSAPCTTDADCDGGTCSGTTTIGVGFPQDIRNCAKCHTDGATATNHLDLPSTPACTGCHDDVNPGETTFHGLAPGTGHLAGPQPEALCRICHKNSPDTEFDITVPGAHVIPLRSAMLAGLQAEMVSASGTPGNPVQVTFRLRDEAGMGITDYGGFNRIAFAIAGPTTDFGGASTPLLTPTAVGGGSSGTLTAPDATGLATYTTAASLPLDATGTWSVGIEARRSVSVNGANVNEAAENAVLEWSVDGSAVVPRREVVAQANCAGCHGTFSKDFSVHGNLRNRVEYCVLCHNPKVTDFARRVGQIANGADPANQTIALKHLIHKVHRGEALEHKPYVVYGFGGGIDFGDVLFPGDLRDCARCHTDGSQFLPLPAGLLPTNVTQVSMGAEEVVGTTPPVRDACLSCHDSDAAAAHAETNTTASGAEACAVCHGEGSVAAVSVVHAPEP